MFITAKQAQERLESKKNLANRFNNGRVVSIIERVATRQGRTLDTKNLTVEQRTEIATRARLDEHPDVLTTEFGIKKAAVSNIKHGRVQGIDEDKVERTLNEVRDHALDRLMHSLGLITDDKLSGCSAKDLSVIASNMGRVVEKIAPRNEGPDNINFIVYAPQLRQEQAFDSVEI